MSEAPRKPPKLAATPEPAGPPEPEPPRREFQFKQTEFERANRPADATPGNAPIDVKELHRQAVSSKPLAAGPSPPAGNEVHALLRANVAQADAKGLNQVAPTPKRPSRRKRDYWLLLASGNLLVTTAVLLAHHNFLTLVLGLAAIVFFSVMLTWIMWMVLDDY